MNIDPPPDLAIESDVTSKTTLEAYAILGVTEVWIYENNKLQIFVLQNKVYVKTINSLIFPNFNLVETIPKLVKQAFDQGTSQMLREFRLSLTTG
jgi:Uma2 family endonuclease